MIRRRFHVDECVIPWRKIVWVLDAGPKSNKNQTKIITLFTACRNSSHLGAKVTAQFVIYRPSWPRWSQPITSSFSVQTDILLQSVIGMIIPIYCIWSTVTKLSKQNLPLIPGLKLILSCRPPLLPHHHARPSRARVISPATIKNFVTAAARGRKTKANRHRD